VNHRLYFVLAVSELDMDWITLDWIVVERITVSLSLTSFRHQQIASGRRKSNVCDTHSTVFKACTFSYPSLTMIRRKHYDSKRQFTSSI